MNWANSEIVAALTFLLPGLLAAVVFYSLTSHPKPSEFDRVVQALVFTTLGQAATWVIRPLISGIWEREYWIDGMDLVVASYVASGRHYQGDLLPLGVVFRVLGKPAFLHCATFKG